MSTALLVVACATTGRHPGVSAHLRLGVLTPLDAVPVREGAVWGAGGRESALVLLRSQLADHLAASGLAVCEDEVPDVARHDLPALAAWGRGEGLDAVVTTELLAYGEVRRSWLWLLAGQGFLAGVGHGVAAARLTGRTATGWWVGLGEFALETVTWVGGALFASHWIDPVVIRCRAVRVGDGVCLGTWTLEGTRPVRHWLRGDPRPRCERLRSVADGLFARVAPKIAAKVANAPARQRGGTA